MKKIISSWIGIFVGCTILAAGFVYFINPYNLVPGGVYGASIVLHNLFPSIQVGTFGYMFDIPLLIISVLVLGAKLATLVDYEDKVMIPEFAQIKVLRAWTYWQLALLCGEVSWIETPILDLEASLKDYPQKNQEQLAELLIEDLKPYIGVRDLNYGSVDGLNLDKVFIPVDMLLGDLYLFLNQYANAATAYYRLIKERELMVTSMYRNSWLDISRRGFSYFTHTSGLSYASSEVVSSFVYSSDAKAYHPLLLRMSYNDKAFIAPAQSFVDEMSNALYVVGVEGKPTVSGYCDGDMRGQAILAGGQVYPSAYGSMTLNNVAATYICKFFNMDNTSVSGSDPENEALGGLYLQRTLPLYRVSHVYLRLAEALNRLEKPTMAFAVLKYGLNATTLENPNRVKQSERKGEIYTDFTEDIFADNVASHPTICPELYVAVC